MPHPSVLLRRVAPALVPLAIVEAALYLLLDRSDTLHDLYRTPAAIVAVLGVLGIVMRLRGRSHGERRHAGGRRREERRDDRSGRATPPFVGRGS